MRKVYVTLVLAMMCFFVTAQTLTEREIIMSVSRMQARYPRITMCDIYKSFFQDYFGPGHIINSKEKAEAYLKSELERTDSMSVRIEPTGAAGNFMRVDVFYIKKGTVSMDLYLDCLMRSVVVVDSAMTEQWLKNWELMQQVIERNGMKIENYEKDKIFINERIANGIYEMNHSRLFNELYHPHYRIIRRDIWEKELKPLIK